MRHGRRSVSTLTSPPHIRIWPVRCSRSIASTRREPSIVKRWHAGSTRPSITRSSGGSPTTRRRRGDATAARLGRRPAPPGRSTCRLSRRPPGPVAGRANGIAARDGIFRGRGMRGFAAMAARYDVVTGALVGDCATARQRRAPALGPSDGGGRAGAGDRRAGHVRRERRAPRFSRSAGRTHPQDTMLDQDLAPADRRRGLARSGTRRAIEALQATAPYEGAAESWPIYLRGLALLRAGHGAGAGPNSRRSSPPRPDVLGPALSAGSPRAGPRTTMAGDVDGASRAYQALFGLEGRGPRSARADRGPRENADCRGSSVA